jgi:hypothetical protein
MFVRVTSARVVARSAISAFVLVALAAAPVRAGFDVFSVGGSTLASSVQLTIDTFRTAIGGVNNGAVASSFDGGRREINWDGGGATTATVTAVSTLSGFTNARGATFTTPGTGFLQTPLDATELTSIQASYQTTFSTLSPVRIFTPTGSNVTTVTFSLPGSAGATPATVSAFGAVFSDVDLSVTTKIEFFNLSNALLQLLNVPPRAPASELNGTLSFMGAVANAGERIGRVVITTGNQALGAADTNGDLVDVVVMDDFLYAEPVAVPEPGAGCLAAAGLAAAGARLRRRSR